MTRLPYKRALPRKIDGKQAQKTRNVQQRVDLRIHEQDRDRPFGGRVRFTKTRASDFASYGWRRKTALDHIGIGSFSAGQLEKVGARLRDARIAKGYSLEDLAIATGLTEVEIAGVENGIPADDHHIERASGIL